MERPWQYDFPKRFSRRRPRSGVLPADPSRTAALSDERDADVAAQAGGARRDRRPSAARVVLRTAAATAAIGLMGVGAFVLVQGIHLQDWGLATWGQQSSIAQRTQQRLSLDSLGDLGKVVFFDATSKKAKVFYSIKPGGEVELFSAGGRNPESGEYLKPITPTVVQQIERRLRQKEQDRLAEAERNAATARADAEIARARRVQSASMPPKRDGQV